MDRSSEEFVTYEVNQLPVGPENTLFHYVHVDVGEGVFMAPGVSSDCGHIHAQLVSNFRAACQIIGAAFARSQRNRDSVRSAAATGTPRDSVTPAVPKPWLSRSLVALREQGMLFHWSPLSAEGKRLPALMYWVCGRQMDGPYGHRQCFVCYHDSAPQVMVELAFRLAYGVHL